MIHIQRFFLSIFLLVFAGTCLAAPAGVNWQWANPTPQGNPYNAVAYNSAIGASVAIGDLGNVVASADGGINWTVQNSNTTQNLNAIYTDATTSFIAVGDGGTIIAEGAAGSPPQLTGIWIDITDGSLTANLNGVAKRNVAGNDLFVAVGDNGTVLTNDGNSYVWTAQTIPNSVLRPAGPGNLVAVTWNGGVFVVVTDNGNILYSANGTTWSYAEFAGFTASTDPVAPKGFRSVIWNGVAARFIAVGDGGIIASGIPAATLWGAVNSGTSSTLFNIVWNDSTYIATSGSGQIIKSTNGINWSSVFFTGAVNNLLSIIWDGSQFIIAGDGATVLTSLNGTGWTLRYPQSVDSNWLVKVFWSDTLSKFLVGSRNPALLSSPDGVSWTSTDMPDAFHDIADNGALLVAVGESGQPYTSTTGISWSQQSITNINGLNAVSWDGGSFIAVGDSGTIFTSPDGFSWTSQTSTTSNSLYDVASNGTKWVAVGGSGTILASTDGVGWVNQPSPVSDQWQSISWNGLQFVAVGFSGKIITSPDGTNWTPRVSGVNQSLFDISWDGAQFITVGGKVASNSSIEDKGVILTSSDGVSWVSQVSNTSNKLFSVAANGARLIAVGVEGTILTSASTHTIGGNVSGLSGSGLMLQNNSTDNLTITADGSFTFATTLDNGSTYDVTVSVQPAGQTCAVSNGSGMLNGANISDIVISCNDNPVVAASSGGGGAFNFYLLMLLPGLLFVLRRRKSMSLFKADVV